MLVDYTLYILYTLVYHELTKLLFFVHPLLQVSYLDGLWGDHKSDISISLTLGPYIYNPTRNNSGSRDYYSRNQQILVIAIGGSKMGGRGRKENRCLAQSSSTFYTLFHVLGFELHNYAGK